MDDLFTVSFNGIDLKSIESRREEKAGEEADKPQYAVFQVAATGAFDALKAYVKKEIRGELGI